jgi:hypothetical protein
MSMVRYSAYRKKQAGGRYVWGVLRQEGRKKNFRTVGEDDDAQEKAEKLAAKLNRMEEDSPDATDRFLSWCRAGEPLPLDRTVRDYARMAKDTVAASTAARYRQFADRLAERLGASDLLLLQEEDVGRFVRAEHADGRAKDPTMNACVLLRSTVLAALRTKDEDGRPHLSDDPLPKITKIARAWGADELRMQIGRSSCVFALPPSTGFMSNSAEARARGPKAAFKGQTPDEMHFGTGGVAVLELATARKTAREQRLKANRAAGYAHVSKRRIRGCCNGHGPECHER